MDVSIEKDTDMVSVEGIEKHTLLAAKSQSENETKLGISEKSCLPVNCSLSDKETWLTEKTSSTNTTSCKLEKIDTIMTLLSKNEPEKEKNMSEIKDNNKIEVEIEPIKNVNFSVTGKSTDTEKSFQNLSERCHRFEKFNDKSLQLEIKSQLITEQLSEDRESIDKHDALLSNYGFLDDKQSEKHPENEMSIKLNVKLSCDSDDYSKHNKSHTFVKAADTDKPCDLQAEIGQEEETPKQNDEDSNAAVMIESSSDEEESEITSVQLQMREEHTGVIDRATSDDDCESISFNDEDEYEDDLMNVVCTSASNNLTKKRSRSLSSSYDGLHSPTSAHQTRKLQQICMTRTTRTVNYAIIAKKRSSKWLNNRNKRELYRSALQKKILKKNPKTASVQNKNTYINSIKSYYNVVPISPKIQETVTKHFSENKQHLLLPSSEVIDLDSSPEKCSTFEEYISENLLKEPGVKSSQDFKNSSSDLEQKLTNNSKNENKNGHLNNAIPPLTLNKVTYKENVNLNDKKSNARMNNQVSNQQNLVSRNDVSDSDLETEDNQIFQSQKTGNFLHCQEIVANFNDVVENRISGKTIPDIKNKQANESTEKTDFEPQTQYQKPQTYLSKEQDSNRYSPSISKTIFNSMKGEKCSERMKNYTRKLREEIQYQCSNHDIINEYIDKTSSNSADEIGRHVTQLVSEIQTLNELIKTKESEWNNMLHIKKIKEEICVRLVRRKQVIELLASKISDKTNANDNGTLQNYENCNHVSSTPNVGVQSNTQRIIQNRANMNSSDLAKEKLNTQRLHRLLVSRNILPVSGNSIPLSSVTKNNNKKQLEVAGSSVFPTEGSPREQPTVLNNYLSSTENIQQLIDIMNEHQFPQNSRNGEFSNGNQNIQQMVGRQGPFKDVKSIIADFRQKHPEITPRRGRRVKKPNTNLLESSYNILGNVLKIDMNSRPSSNDSSSHSAYNSNLSGVISNTEKTNIGVSVKDFLEPLLKSNEQITADTVNSSTIDTSVDRTPKHDPIHQQDPQITLHPVGNSHGLVDGVDQPSGSLLHGILTKYTRSAQMTPFTKSSLQHHQQQGTTGSNYISNFSPTLARLLTNPENVSSAPAKNNSQRQSSACPQNCSVGVSNGSINVHSIPNFGTHFSKVIGHQNGEVTITPVMNSTKEPSILQQQLQQQQKLKAVLTKTPTRKFNDGKNNCLKKEQNFIKLAYIADNEDGDDSIGRLVIDEGNESVLSEDQQPRIALQTVSREINENEVPLCQGCKSHEAQFVCAGCGNQWYCSRECQVAAWDDHSEVCTG